MAVGVAGAAELVASLTAGAATVDKLMAAVVEKTANDLVGLIQRNASQRPGPNAPTGDYRGSWGPPVPIEAGLGTISFSVGTDRPQAARLEYGFGGTDAADTAGIAFGPSGQAGVDILGRHYHQQPLPHMGPAVDEIEPIFHAAMDAVAAKAVTW